MRPILTTVALGLVILFSVPLSVRADAEKIETPTATPPITNADYAQHLMAFNKKFPGNEFQAVIQAPFIVITDGGPDLLASASEKTVKWAVALLKKDYFGKDPDHIIEIWLFKDNESYRRNTKKIFGDTPSTPYGYYSAKHRALIMNIATGGGTLVHEIVHPFVAANFPDCPAWLNEGLGSLYEQCGERNAHIIGNTNWRLAGIQKLIKAGKVPTFQELTGTTSDEFYGGDRGDNYAQARYLCYYLQEQGLLVKFYQQFVANQKDDPTGYKTLKKILGEDDMIAFQKKWEEFVIKLNFP